MHSVQVQTLKIRFSMSIYPTILALHTCVYYCHTPSLFLHPRTSHTHTVRQHALYRRYHLRLLRLEPPLNATCSLPLVATFLATCTYIHTPTHGRPRALSYSPLHAISSEPAHSHTDTHHHYIYTYIAEQAATLAGRSSSIRAGRSPWCRCVWQRAARPLVRPAATRRQSASRRQTRRLLQSSLSCYAQHLSLSLSFSSVLI